MKITCSDDQRIIHIKNNKISYVMEIIDGKYPVHRYFGKAIRSYRGTGIPRYFKRGYSTEHELSVEHISFDDVPFEYPVRGSGDYRIPAFTVTQEDGVTFTSPVFSGLTVTNGKPEIPGLPSISASPAEAKTLELWYEDPRAGLKITSCYTIIGDEGVILRHQKIENIGSQRLMIQNAQSFSLELPAREYDFLSLYGTHAKEANRFRFRVHHGIQKIESTRGSSSPQHQPFFALLSPDTSEEKGEVYAFHLVYSGNFLAQTECDQFGNVRAQMGIHPDTFCWDLAPGETFYTPEAVLSYSSGGLNSMSHNFHTLYRRHLFPGSFAGKERPVLLNSWEAMYYDVSLEKIAEQSALAKELGMELFVLDDGWFRAGNDSRSSAGDWICNEEKLPGGIRAVSELVRKNGLRFGLWFEPEAISRKSRIYEKHPDWALHVPGYGLTEGRHEYVLDLTREDVRSCLKKMLDSFLKDGSVEYIKWDMNRPLTDVSSALLPSRKKDETFHRYVLGLYDILSWLKASYPNVLVEGCSSGGARFDPGMLYYVSQNWASDNTDAFDRTVIQSGFSLLYPPEVIGAHVSITPNHQTGRATPLDTRYQIARLFNLGYELDLTKCTKEECEAIRRQTAEHREERSRFLAGTFYRHDVPNVNYVMWSVVTEDECLAVIFQKFFDPLCSHGRFRLLGLDSEADYTDTETGEVFGGDELMEIGVTVPPVKEDFHAFVIHLKKTYCSR